MANKKKRRVPFWWCATCHGTLYAARLRTQEELDALKASHAEWHKSKRLGVF